jgi:hypothetical protein
MVREQLLKDWQWKLVNGDRTTIYRYWKYLEIYRNFGLTFEEFFLLVDGGGSAEDDDGDDIEMGETEVYGDTDATFSLSDQFDDDLIIEVEYQVTVKYPDGSSETATASDVVVLAADATLTYIVPDCLVPTVECENVEVTLVGRFPYTVTAIRVEDEPDAIEMQNISMISDEELTARITIPPGTDAGCRSVTVVMDPPGDGDPVEATHHTALYIGRLLGISTPVTTLVFEPNLPITFTANVADPTEGLYHVAWQAFGAAPENWFGGTFTTQWDAPGVHTVAANMCGWDWDSVDITLIQVEFDDDTTSEMIGWNTCSGTAGTYLRPYGPSGTFILTIRDGPDEDAAVKRTLVSETRSGDDYTVDPDLLEVGDCDGNTPLDPGNYWIHAEWTVDSATARATAPLAIVRADLDADIDHDGTVEDSEPTEGTTPGLIIGVNDDDSGPPTGPDCGNDQIDGTADEADMTKLAIRRIDPPTGTEGGTVTLTVDHPECIRIFYNGAEKIGPGSDGNPDKNTWPFPVADIAGSDITCDSGSDTVIECLYSSC